MRTFKEYLKETKENKSHEKLYTVKCGNKIHKHLSFDTARVLADDMFKKYHIPVKLIKE